jgi:acetylornithine deacetylase/succinyl-diaminopimelate desuccinylase-like protein
MNELELTKQLISLPSEVNEKCNEERMGNFIYEFCKSIPWLKTSKQFIDKKRFNVIAQSNGEPKLLLAGHMDTVPKKMSQKIDSKQIGNKLYGLGALDTKGGIASLLVALKNLEEIEGLICVFYCDEEYNFLGMKKFLEIAPKNLDQALFIEPSDLKLWDAHRGAVEIKIAIEGKTGHASDPQNGNNAIVAFSRVIPEFESWLQRFYDPILGQPSFNVASIQGGLKPANSESDIGSQGNCIADYVEILIDIRPTTQELTAGSVTDFLSDSVKKFGCKLASKEIRLDFGPLSPIQDSFSDLKSVIQEITGNKEVFDPANRGYGDGQLLNEKLKIPVAYFGPRGRGMHEESEYVEIDSLTLARRVYETFIQRVLGHANSQRRSDER